LTASDAARGEQWNEKVTLRPWWEAEAPWRRGYGEAS